jgi:hypothetical protein
MLSSNNLSSRGRVGSVHESKSVQLVFDLLHEFLNIDGKSTMYNARVQLLNWRRG